MTDFAHKTCGDCANYDVGNEKLGQAECLLHKMMVSWQGQLCKEGFKAKPTTTVVSSNVYPGILKRLDVFPWNTRMRKELHAEWVGVEVLEGTPPTPLERAYIAYVANCEVSNKGHISFKWWLRQYTADGAPGRRFSTQDVENAQHAYHEGRIAWEDFKAVIVRSEPGAYQSLVNSHLSTFGIATTEGGEPLRLESSLETDAPITAQWTNAKDHQY